MFCKDAIYVTTFLLFASVGGLVIASEDSEPPLESGEDCALFESWGRFEDDCGKMLKKLENFECCDFAS